MKIVSKRRRKALATGVILLTVFGITAAADDRIIWSPDRRYAFPLKGQVELMAWERMHWDGSSAVDIEADPSLGHQSDELERFEQSAVIAVTDGFVRRVDNERGGIAIELEGDDGYRYYYAHLTDPQIPSDAYGRGVRAGERLGTIGRTGRWSRYIETHLHFSVTDRRGRVVNAADWFEELFALSPIDREWPEYEPDTPRGPIVTGGYRVVSTFAQMRARNSDVAAVEVRVEGPILSALAGEVRTMRNTVFGRRVQVTNRHTDQTVVVSGLESLDVTTGDLVRRGDVLGVAAGVIHVMYFDNGVPRDPLPVVLMPPEEAHHPGEEKN